jgi:tape measure domain-containing protein
MAEYRLQFTADTSAAGRSISDLQKAIKAVTKEFEKAEIGSEEFADSASDLSRLKKELGDARSAVVNIDRAYRELNKAIESNFAIYQKVGKAAESYHKKLIDLAQDSFKQEDALREKNYRAELADFDRRLNAAASARRKMAAQQRAIMEFRAGMGARGAIPEIASPVRGTAQQFGSPAYIDAFSKSLKSAIAEAKQIRPDPKAFQPLSLADYETKLKRLKEEARLISPSDVKWKALNKQILEAQKGVDRINRMQSGGPTARQRAGAAGGAFLYGGGLGGGIGSAVGGIAGGLLGGVPGAFTGAALGQAADSLGMMLSGITTQASSLVQLQRGLAMASADAQDFAQAQEAVVGISQRLLMPLEEATRYFTQLRANTREYNMTVADTAKIMEGTALAIAATGGSSEDLSGAMRAVVQIMSKGGVQAEELRGQLGERFPGAVVKFAKANKMSFEELQDALQNGKVGIADFVKFAEQNYEDYAQFSEKLATAPEFAGRRLQLAFEGLTREIGGLFAPMGASIQDALTEAINGISNFVKENRAYLRQMIRDWQTIVGPIAKVLLEILKLVGQFSVQVGKVFQGIFSSFRQAVGLANIGEAKARLDRARAATAGKARPARNVRGGGGIWRELQQAEAAYRDLGGDAAFKAASGPLQPEGLIFGGPGAGMSIDRQKEDEDKKKKTNLEAFERLRDQLADAYNRAEIERIKARYELEKRLREDLFDVQEFGANRLQRQNLQFLRALVTAEQERFEANLEARLNVVQEAGRVDQATSAFAGAGAGAGLASGSISIVEFGKALQKMGFTVREHPAFGGVGRHSPNSYHYSGEALDITDWRPGDWKGRTKALGEALRGSGAASEIFHPGYDPVGGHSTHLHAAFRGGRVPLTPGIQSLMGGSISPGAARKVGGNEARDTMAAANTEIAKGVALETERSSALVKSSAQLKALAQYTQDVYNIPDLILDTQLQKKRNDLIEAGVDENVIDYQVRLYEIELQRQHLLKALPNFIKEANLSEKDRLNLEEKLTEAFNASKQAEKEKNDETQRGIAIQRSKEINDYIKSLREEIALLRAVTEEERARLEIQQQYEFASEEQRNQIYDLRQIKQNLEEARRVIDEFVTGTTSDYKGFLKAVISGEDAKDALRQFQEGLSDRVLTIFLDFAMAPVEQFFQEQLKGIMNSLMPKAAIEDTPQTRNTSALDRNTAAIEANTAAQTGTPSSATASASTGVGGAMATVSNEVKAGAADIASSSMTLGQSLGMATQAIGIAAGSIMGIAAGVSQIKQGSTSGVLGGIGSILLSVGGAIGGFGKLFGGLGGGAGAVAGAASWGGSGFNPTAFSPGLKLFANGGMVTGPTLGLVGEGRYNEAIVPLPDGRSIPVQLQGDDIRDKMGSAMGNRAATPMLSMSFQSTVINGVEYVDRAQLEAAMAETRRMAAREGANKGANLAIDRLANSPSSRRRVGIR